MEPIGELTRIKSLKSPLLKKKKTLQKEPEDSKESRWIKGLLNMKPRIKPRKNKKSKEFHCQLRNYLDKNLRRFRI